MESKKKVLILVGSNIFGGAERVLADYLRENQDFEFFIYTNRKFHLMEEYQKILDKKHVYGSRWVLCRWNLRRYPYRGIQWMISLFHSTWVIQRLVKKLKIDVVYGNNSTDLPVLHRLKKKMPQLPNIAHIHDLLETDSMMGRYLCKNYSSLDHILVPSIANQAYIRTLTNGKVPIEVAYNSVTLPEYLPEKQESKVIRIGFIGTISERKNPLLFVRIIRRLHAIQFPYEAIMAGAILDPKLFQEIQEEIQKDALHITYLGTLETKKMAELYKKMDVLLLTSQRDSLPTVILEAMAYRVLVLAKRIGGVSEIIEHERNGFLFEEEDKEAQIADELVQMSRLSKKRKKEIEDAAIQTLHQKFSEIKKRRIIGEVIHGIS